MYLVLPLGSQVGVTQLSKLTGLSNSYIDVIELFSKRCGT